VDRRSRPAAGKRLTPSVLTLSVATLLVAFSAHAQNEKWRSDKPCGERHGTMQPTAAQGCYRAWCSDTALGKLCACVRESTDDIHFVLERTARGKEEWKAPFVPPLGGDAAHFRIDRVGDQSLLLAVMRSESVGIAVSDWSVWAIDSEKISQPLEVQNYGTFSFPTSTRAGAACYLLAARWHPGWEPRRGHGTYIAGSWYALENGAFSRVADRPAIYRRYLSAVERARYAAEESGGPLLWFRTATPVVGPRPITGKGAP
jgi:hypothetical protein